MMKYIDIHTHQHYGDDTVYIYNVMPGEAAALPARYSLGIHPWYAAEPQRQLAQLQALLETLPDTLFIGECGLDKICATPWEDQLVVFSEQLKLAAYFRKPVIIHCVRAYQECLQLLKDCKVPVIFHGFNKHPELAAQIVRHGHYLSIGPAILQHPARYSEILQAVSPEHIFLETDRYAVPVEAVYRAAASILKIETDDVILQIQKNYSKIINVSWKI